MPHYYPLIIAKQRITLRILLAAAVPDILAHPNGDRNAEGDNKKEGHDGKGKDPLQGNGLGEELTDTNGSREYAQGKPHSVVLVSDDIEHAVGEDTPDQDIAEDTGHQGAGFVQPDGTVPEDGNEGPGERAGDGGKVDELVICVVAEVEDGEVDEVEDEEQLSPAEQGADEKHDKAEVEEIVCNEVGGDRGGVGHHDRVGGEEVADVAQLGDEEDEEVETSNERVHSEGSVEVAILLPDAAAGIPAIGRVIEGIVNGGEDREQPGQDGERLVDPHAAGSVGFALGEGVK